MGHAALDRVFARWRALGLVMLLAMSAGLAGCGAGKPAAEAEHGDEHAGEPAGAHDDEKGDEHAAEEESRGPHGGRLFEAGATRFELAISEDDGSPSFRGYLLDAKGATIAPTSERLTVQLTRFGGRVEEISFRTDGDHLHSEQVIGEPHSFTARIRLEAGGAHEWSFEQVESRITLSKEAVQSSGIAVGTAAPTNLDVSVATPGEVRLNAERAVLVRPRFAGVVREMRKQLGAAVRVGDVLAIVQSNESLADYSIVASTAGTVVSRDAAVGQVVSTEQSLYTVADLSTVWVDFPIPSHLAGRIRAGQRAMIRSEAQADLKTEGRVSYVGPILEKDTRVAHGRVVLDDRGKRWQPGLFVTVDVIVESVRVAVAVPEDAIVRMTDGPAVFRSIGDEFEMQPVTLGRTDGRLTEIVEGLEAGARVATRNTFLLKAELGKAGASHDH